MASMAHLELLLFFLLVGVTVSTGVSLHKRIVGGYDCKDDESQHHVKLTIKKKNKLSLCGSSLISDQWILTAAHCLEDGETIEAEFNVHAGVHKPVTIEPKPVYSPQGKKHDIVLLKLPFSITKIKPIPLPDCKKDMPKIGEEFQTAGFGLDKADDVNNEFLKHIPNKLQCVSINFADCKETQAELKAHYPNIPFENWMCGKAPKKDSAQGDSGGGVVYKGKLHGVITGGHPTHAFKEPFEFLSVCKYLDWIKKAI